MGTQEKIIEENYPLLGRLFRGYLNEDWMDIDGTLIGAIQDFLNNVWVGVEETDVKAVDSGRKFLSQLHAELTDITGKGPEEQWDILRELHYNGPAIESKWQAEMFFLALLHLTEAEMRRRGVPIPEGASLCESI